MEWAKKTAKVALVAGVTALALTGVYIFVNKSSEPKKRKVLKRKVKKSPEKPLENPNPVFVEYSNNETAAPTVSEFERVMEQAKVSFKEGDMESAIACYSVASLIEPLNARVYLNRARCFYRLEDFSSCLSNTETSLAMDDTKHDTVYMRSLALMGLERYGEARDCLSGMIRDFKLPRKTKATAIAKIEEAEQLFIEAENRKHELEMEMEKKKQEKKAVVIESKEFYEKLYEGEVIRELRSSFEGNSVVVFDEVVEELEDSFRRNSHDEVMRELIHEQFKEELLNVIEESEQMEASKSVEQEKVICENEQVDQNLSNSEQEVPAPCVKEVEQIVEVQETVSI